MPFIAQAAAIIHTDVPHWYDWDNIQGWIVTW
ncbi:MAG: hypothetical protein QOI80_3456, partial [Solirubrobacteraceae bacterium]|nr:hypothetical protein [Solirubrobacteraceae bacterium]